MNNETPQEPAVQSSDVCYSSQYPTDEIDLLDIWRVLVSQRKLILIVTLLVSLLAVGYAQLTPRIYKAETFLLPPLGKDVEGFNLPDIRRITVDTVYNEMIKNLHSLSLRRQFFDEQKLAKNIDPSQKNNLSEERLFFEKFHKLLSVQRGKKGKADFCTVSLEGGEPGLIKVWLNDFISMVNFYTVSKLAEVVETEIKNKKKSINEKIEGLRQTAANRRLDRIIRLQEQFYIAEKLGIVKRNDGAAFPPQGQNTPEMGLSINTAGTPIYLRGTEELQAEIDILQKRKNDDPFIGNLRDLQEELARFEKIGLDRDDINAVRIDRMAVQPEDPIKPKRKLIVVLGLMLGLMLGLFAAFLTNFIETNRNRL